MRIKLKHPSKQIKLTLSARQKRQIQRLLGYCFEATITSEGLLLHSTKQKYRLSDLLAQCVDMPDFEESKEWMTRKPVGREML
jgi:antitoxin component of MazEF toxin-antitoxin module